MVNMERNMAMIDLCKGTKCESHPEIVINNGCRSKRMGLKIYYKK